MAVFNDPPQDAEPRSEEAHIVTLVLPRELASTTTSETDPIRFYERPIVGWLYRQRIEMGLQMIPSLPENARGLEVGYASGIVLFNLAGQVRELHGLDLDADPITTRRRLHSTGVDARLVRGSVTNMRDIYEDNFFDLVVCFSVLEHVPQPASAVSEIVRVLKPGGVAIIGMPAVNRFMEFAFQAIGFKGIEDHHITTPLQVWQLVQQCHPRVTAVRRSLPGGVPFGVALYHEFGLRKS